MGPEILDQPHTADVGLPYEIGVRLLEARAPAHHSPHLAPIRVVQLHEGPGFGDRCRRAHLGRKLLEGVQELLEGAALLLLRLDVPAEVLARIQDNARCHALAVEWEGLDNLEEHVPEGAVEILGRWLRCLVPLPEPAQAGQEHIEEHGLPQERPGTPETLDELKRLYWKNSRPYFDKLKDKKPANDLERFHKFIYLNRFSYFSKPGRFASYNPGEDGTVFRQFDKFLKGKERLEKTIIRTGDYEKVIREFDGPQTFFFLDPPFPGYDQSVGESEFDEERFVKVLHDIRGKFLLTYGLKSDRALFDKFQVRRVMVPTATPAGLDRRPLLFIANYDIRKRKRARWARRQNASAACEDSPAHETPSPSPLAHAARPDPTQDQEMAPFYKRVVDLAQPIIKRGSEEERFTLGVVLEPDVVDAQNDQYSKEEVRRACHRFAEFYLNAGLMHRELANGRIVILENYLAPCDFVAENGEAVKEGTWLQGRGYRNDEIWQKIKNGELTGLSIGGSAIRKPMENTKDTELEM